MLSAQRIAFAVLLLAVAHCVAADVAAEQNTLLKKIQLDPAFSDNYVDLGNTLEDPEDMITLLPQKLNRKGLYLLAIRLDPKNAVAYNNLAVSMNSLDEKIELPDGESVTKQKLFLKAIEADPKFGHAYNNLAETMTPGQSLTYPDGREVDRLHMFVKAIELDPSFPYSYNNLGVILAENALDGQGPTKVSIPTMPHEQVALGHSIEVDARQCFLRCISLGKHSATGHCYKNLASLLADHETVKLLGEDGDMLDKRECLVRAQDHGVTPKGQQEADDDV